MAIKSLIINPGSTSTKMAVFDDETPVLVRNIVHTPDDLARFDVADELRAHDAEGAGFAGNHIPVADLADAQGLDAVLVPGGIDAVLRHDHECIAAFHHVQRLHDVHDTVLARALLD